MRALCEEAALGPVVALGEAAVFLLVKAFNNNNNRSGLGLGRSSIDFVGLVASNATARPINYSDQSIKVITFISRENEPKGSLQFSPLACQLINDP